jgi:hypothetical protein
MKLNFVGTIFTIFLLINPCLAQRANQIIIYSNKSDFLVPFIKTTLEEMVDNKTGQKLISKASNLNLLFVNTDADRLLRSSLDYNFPDKSFDILKDEKLKDSLLDVFVKNDYFLLVNENILLDQIEFQLVLYKISKDTAQNIGNKNKFPFKNLIRPIAENNFFVDIKSANYLDVLKNGVKKLLPNSNYLPRFEIALKGNIVRLGLNHYSTSFDDTIYIPLLNIYDEDNPLDQIKFKLKIFSQDGIDISQYAAFDYRKNEFIVQIPKLGRYKLIASAFDGISTSSLDTMTLEIISLPKIFVLTDRFEFTNSAFLPRKKFILDIPVFVQGTDSNFEFQSILNQRKKPENERLLDSLTSNNQKIDNYFSPEDRKSKKNKHEHNTNKYSEAVTKITDSFYSIRITKDYLQGDSLIKIWGESKGLKTNIQNIFIKSVDLLPAVFLYGPEFNLIDMIKKDTVKASITFNSFNFINLNLRIYQYGNLNLGLSFAEGVVMNSIPFKRKMPGISSIKGRTESLGIFGSLSTYGNKFRTEIAGGFNVKSLPFALDSSGIYDYGKTYYTYGVKSQLLVTSIRLKGLGLFFESSFGSGKYFGIRNRQTSFGIGVLYNPSIKPFNKN